MKFPKPQRIKRGGGRNSSNPTTPATTDERRASPDHQSWDDGLSAETSISSRTGGFVVVPQHTYSNNYHVNDDDTIADASIYTGGVPERKSCDNANLADDDSIMDISVYTGGDEQSQNDNNNTSASSVACHSQAPTVRASPGKSSSPIYVDDIKHQITSFKDAVRKHWAIKQSRDDDDDSDEEDDASLVKEFSPKSPETPPRRRRTSSRQPASPETFSGGRKSPRSVRGVRNHDGCSWSTPSRGSGTTNTALHSETYSQRSVPRTVASRTFHSGSSRSAPAHHFPSIKEDQEEDEAELAAAAVSYLADKRGGGYEVIDERHRRHEKGHEYADCDDPSIDLGLSYDDETEERTISSGYLSMINVTDNSLMDRPSSPGSLRLTADSIQHHEQKTLLSSLCTEPENSYDAWKKEKERRKWRRGKHQEIQERLQDQNIRIREADRLDSSPDRTAAKTKRNLVSALMSGLKKEDVSDVSLAPLNTMENISPVDQGGRKSRLFSRLLRPRDPSIAAKELLEKERAAARESRQLQKLKEKQEKERIERKRAAYLRAQRAKESVHRSHNHHNSSNHLGSLDSVMEFSRSTSDTSRTRSASQDLSTISSLTQTLPPCKICGTGERTHIASPCMHFAFCEPCASKLERRGPSPRCPICSTENVTFACVSV